jgi:hypothetical protein
MIELNAEQRQAVAQGEPVQIVDPLTHDAYVLLRAEVFARLSGVLPRPVGQPNPEISPLMLRSQQAFWQDLPGLLKVKRNRGKWAAYHGEERVAIWRTEVEAYQECFRRGLKRGESYVGKLEADPDGIPPWGTLQSDWSLYEGTDEDPPNPHEDPRATADIGVGRVSSRVNEAHPGQQPSTDFRGRSIEQPPCGEPLSTGVSPFILRAEDAFRRDLPQLLEERPGQWVAYHGHQRIGFAATKPQLYQECLNRGLPPDEFHILCIEPEMGDLMFGPGAIEDLVSERE